MTRCPNCFRDTMRTKDWACYLCGYPLASPAFKVIDKTYSEIRQERLNAKKQPVQVDEQIYDNYDQERDIIQEIQDVPLVNEIEISEKYEAVDNYDTVIEDHMSEEPLISYKIPGYVSATEEEKEDNHDEAEEEAKEETAEDKEDTIAEDEINEQEDIEAAEYKVESIENDIEVQECSGADDDNDKKVDEDEAKPAPFVEEEPENIPVQLVEEEPENQPVEEAAPVPQADIDITIDELLADYAADYVSATNKYVNKRLRMSGYAAAIDLKEVLAIHYIRLTDASLNVMKSVQCMFDKKYADSLRSLEKGQQIIIQGKYTGSLIAMRMADCVLINC